jgi:hypothetical protein
MPFAMTFQKIATTPRTAKPHQVLLAVTGRDHNSSRQRTRLSAHDATCLLVTPHFENSRARKGHFIASPAHSQAGGRDPQKASPKVAPRGSPRLRMAIAERGFKPRNFGSQAQRACQCATPEKPQLLSARCLLFPELSIGGKTLPIDADVNSKRIIPKGGGNSPRTCPPVVAVLGAGAVTFRITRLLKLPIAAQAEHDPTTRKEEQQRLHQTRTIVGCEITGALVVPRARSSTMRSRSQATHLCSETCPGAKRCSKQARTAFAESSARKALKLTLLCNSSAQRRGRSLRSPSKISRASSWHRLCAAALRRSLESALPAARRSAMPVASATATQAA